MITLHPDRKAVRVQDDKINTKNRYMPVCDRNRNCNHIRNANYLLLMQYLIPCVLPLRRKASSYRVLVSMVAPMLLQMRASPLLISMQAMHADSTRSLPMLPLRSNYEPLARSKEYASPVPLVPCHRGQRQNRESVLYC